MINKIIDLGDSDGDGHQIKLTLFDNGSLIVKSFDPDTGNSDQVVLLPQQWQATIQILVAAFGSDACPFHRQPNLCDA